jgi:3-oxoacyl-[acyl-carrier protein] reductase
MPVHDAKVLVTGGTSGIGRETARLLTEHGAKVVICGTRRDALERTTGELGVMGRIADVRRPEEVDALFAFTLDRLGGLDVLVNNAGIGHFAPLVDTSVSDLQRLWEVNVKGAFLCGQRAARHFIQQRSGNIINIASTAAQRGFANGTAYVATKFALAGMTECWRAELRQHNVRVMQVNPSEVVTDFFVRAGDHSQPANVERKLKPTEVAHVILAMLTMNAVGFITEASVWATNPF